MGRSAATGLGMTLIALGNLRFDELSAHVGVSKNRGTPKWMQTFWGKYWIQNILTLDSASVVLDILRNLMGSLMYGELYGIMATLSMSGIVRDLL